MTSQAAIPRRRPYWTRAIAVMKEWLRCPSQVASIIPSFPFLTEQIADRDCVRSAQRIVDLGPGTGGTTERLLKHAGPDCRVLAIEKATGFIEPLEEIGDSRLTVVQDDVVGLERVLMIHDFKSPDVIVSGIPFSSLDAETAESTIKAIHRDLSVGGTFIAYQLRSHVVTYAEPLFGKPTVTNVILNLPPLRVFTWTKNAE
ncbi:class I SAM-dependent methyltransferase [Allorhodopirellula heiligendammensis]|uniref:16S ribosomal RNA methyltransferase KsgA/Dim1 family protein n=1 Tax=Allorhodopirellula heiligendammensis TaxID=2714739 RepID=A0A5C6BVG7_9BACT|nr:rRNA adenine N-6-methyltransferase family protein [Allorhodopirellula heiligendammensis]TWU15647.1 16S ribosomal RNA methyltransferase KsgA/Dim1 family protein [Allorhodopirellula heiligendammensis]